MPSVPSVSILIPFRDKVELLNQCLRTLEIALEKQADHVEVLLLNNGSTDDSLRLLNIPKALSTKRLDLNIPFNFQKINNLGVEKALGRFLLFLNNDIIFTQESDHFLQSMCEHASKEEVGAVSPLLLYPDKKIQHAGGVVGMNYQFSHLYHGWSFEEANQFPYKKFNEDRYVTTVTAACMMVEKSKFLQVGGFDEKFMVYGGDLNLCLKLFDAGYKNLFLGTKRMIHMESKSTGRMCSIEDYWLMDRMFKSFLRRHGGRDPCYPPHLSLWHIPPKENKMKYFLSTLLGRAKMRYHRLTKNRV